MSTITALSPATIPARSDGQTLVVTGTGFASTDTVRLDGASRATTYVSATTLTAVLLHTDLAAAQAVGTTQATIVHGLGYTPTVVDITMTSAGTIWKSGASDATNIYLTSDAAGRTAEVYVR